MELARIAAEPGTILLGGKEYRPAKIRPRDIAYLESWFKEVTPDPRVSARAAMEGLPPEVQKHIWDTAREEARSWPPTINSEAGRALVQTGEGIARIVFASLRQTIAGFTMDQAWDVTDCMTFDDIGRFFGMIFPEPDAEGDVGPKAAAGRARPTLTGTA